MRRRLLPIVDWVTPNLHELAVLTGEPVRTAEDLPRAARRLQQLASESGAPHGCAPGVFAKGGHLDRPDDLLLAADGSALWLPGERIETTSTHGTGCALSSSFLSGLVIGRTSQEAARSAKRYVAEALRQAEAIGSGAGPINHLWSFANPSL